MPISGLVQNWFLPGSKYRLFNGDKCTDIYLLGGQDGDGDLLSLSGFNKTLKISTGALLRDPARLLGIVGLGLELDLKLRGHK